MQVRDVALMILNHCEERQIYVNLSLKNSQPYNQLSAKDKALGYRLIYGVLQNRQFLDYNLNHFMKKKIERQSLPVRNILRLGAYQLLFLDKIPAHAACNEAVNQAKKHGFKYASGFINGVLRNLNRQKAIPLPDRVQDPTKFLAIRYSHPEWLIQRWIKHHGMEIAEKVACANNQEVGLSVRINPLKTTQEEIGLRFTEQQIAFEKGKMFPEQVLRVKTPHHLVQTSWFKQGLITLQNEGSLWLAQGLDVQPGMKVLDMCSAPGGKTALMATWMHNTGSIMAVDVHSKRLKLVQDTCSRLGITNVKTHLADAATLTVAQVGSFDRILCDVPCTGLGTLRSKPEIRWYRSENDIHALHPVQLQLLRTACQLLKKGGQLVYSTCSNEKEETDDIVNQLLRENSAIVCAERQHLWPFMHDSEGFFRAVLSKVK